MVDFEVTEGNRYELDYLLENRGQESKTEDVELRVDGELVDSDASITLDPGNTATGTLETDAFGEDDVNQTFNIELISDNKRTRLIEVIDDIVDSEGDHQWDTIEGSGTLVEDTIGNLNADFTGLNWETGAGTDDVFSVLNGVDEFADMGEDAFTSFITDSEGTLFRALKVDSDASGALAPYASRSTSSGNNFSTRVDLEDNEYSFDLAVDGVFENIAGGTPKIDEWVILAFVQDADGMHIYEAPASDDFNVSRVATSSDDPSAGTGEWDDSVSIGRETGFDRWYFDGGHDYGFYAPAGRSQSNLQSIVDDLAGFY